MKRVDEKKIFVCTGLCYGLLNVALFENLVMYVQDLVMYIQNLVIYLKILWSCDIFSKILWCILYILWCMFNILWCIFENLVMYIQYLVMYIRKSCDVYSIILWCMCNNSFLGNMMQWWSLKVRTIFIGLKWRKYPVIQLYRKLLAAISWRPWKVMSLLFSTLLLLSKYLISRQVFPREYSSTEVRAMYCFKHEQ